MTEVAVVKCDDYNDEYVEKALREAFSLLGGLETIIKPGNTVLLKVNLLSPKPPEAAVTTHPVVVKAMIRLVKELGGIPWVGDSSGGVIASGEAPTGQALRISGVAAAAEEEGAQVFNFDTAGVYEKETGGAISPVHVAKPVLDADVVITMPKLKTHSATYFTGAVKNMYGSVPGFRKAEYHRLAPKLETFSGLLADIYRITRPVLAVMDGILAMEGNGPSAGNPRKLGVLLVSYDAVALDAVACQIIGLPPMKVPLIRIADERGLGVGRSQEIKVLGEEISRVRVTDFVLPANSYMNMAPSFVARYFFDLLKARPEVDKASCTGCEYCARNCPVQVITIRDKYPEINYSKCIECLCCQELCPQKAMTLKPQRWLGKLIARRVGKRRARERGNI